MIGGGESVGEGVVRLVERPADEGDDRSRRIAHRQRQAAPQHALGSNPAAPAGADLCAQSKGLQGLMLDVQTLGIGVGIEGGGVGSPLLFLRSGRGTGTRYWYG